MEIYVDSIIYTLEATDKTIEETTTPLDIDEQVLSVGTDELKATKTNFAGARLGEQKIIALDGVVYAARIKHGIVKLIIGQREYKCTIVPSAQKVTGVIGGINANEHVEVDSAVRPAYIIAGDNVYNIISMRRAFGVPRLLAAGLGLTGVYAVFGIAQAVRSFWA